MYLKENMLIRNKCNLEEAFKDKVLTKEDVVNAKPDPEIYLKAIQMLELKPEDCIVIEDSLNGIQSAVNAGLEVISIYDRYSEACMDEIIKLSNYHVNNYLELIEILDNENI
jgi:beta-phosphoglucomutase-like phosphatase (HAD superfamily)